MAARVLSSHGIRSIAQASSPSALSVASQAVGAAQLVLLTRAGGAGIATDAYFFLFTMALLPVQVLLVGVSYPLRLRGAQPGTSRRYSRMTPPLSAAATLAGALWLLHIGRLPDHAPWLIGLLALNGWIAAWVWDLAVTHAASGRPNLLAAVALPANTVAVIAIVYPWQPPALRVAVMIGGLLLGNLAAVLWVRRVCSPVDPRAETATSDTYGGWYFAKSVTGHGALALTQGIAATLPPAGVTAFAVATRIVGGIGTTTISAVLPRYVHASSASVEDGLRILKLAMLVSATLMGLLVIWSMFVTSDYRAVVALSGIWLVATATNTVLQRLSYRFLPPSVAVLSILAVLAAMAGLTIVSTRPFFTLEHVITAAILTDALPAVLLLRVLGRRLASLGTALAIAVPLALVWSVLL